MGFFGSLVIDRFLNLKLNIFIIIFIIICSKEYVKQVVFINHSWIFPTLQRKWGLGFCIFSRKWGKVHFSPKKREVGKIVEESYYRMVTYVCRLYLCL